MAQEQPSYIPLAKSFCQGIFVYPKRNWKTLKKHYQSLLLHIEKLNEHAVRDKKGDFRLIPPDELTKVLQNETNAKNRIQLINTEIGYLRCNIFSEYYERMKLAEKKNKLDESVTLMNQYAEIAIPFVSPRKKPLIKRIQKRLLRKKITEEPDHVKNWKDRYGAWLQKKNINHLQADDQKRMEEFTQLRTAFFQLYTYSFSLDNFPPLRNRRSDR